MLNLFLYTTTIVLMKCLKSEVHTIQERTRQPSQRTPLKSQMTNHPLHPPPPTKYLDPRDFNYFS